MNSIKFLCFALILAGLGCRHVTAPSARDKELQWNKLADEITLAGRDFIAAITVRDLDAPNETVLKIQEIANRLDRISEEFSRLGPISKELKFRLLEKMEFEDKRQAAISRESVRVFTPEEDKIITPAAELFFAKMLAATTKAGLYYTSSEYEAIRPDRAAPAAPWH
jgi:hypothetical protein